MKAKRARLEASRPQAPERSVVARLGPAAAALLLAAIAAYAWHAQRARDRTLRMPDPRALLPPPPAPPTPELVDPPAKPLVEQQPWQATPEASPPPPSGQVPAWQVHPPAPDREVRPPPDPTPPPDPMATRPALSNPGGVNGARPPREP